MLFFSFDELKVKDVLTFQLTGSFTWVKMIPTLTTAPSVGSSDTNPRLVSGSTLSLSTFPQQAMNVLIAESTSKLPVLWKATNTGAAKMHPDMRGSLIC